MTVLNRTGRVFSTLREAGTGQPVLTFRAAMAAKSLSGAVSPNAVSTSRGNLYHRRRAAHRLSYAERNGGVGIAEIIVLLKAGIDLCSASCIISTAAGKRCLNAGQGLGIDGVHTGLCQVSHPACHFGAAAADMVQKTLQVAGDQDIHGRRSRLVEGTAGIIGTGLDKVGQDVILVGSANQLAQSFRSARRSPPAVPRQHCPAPPGGSRHRSSTRSAAPGDPS